MSFWTGASRERRSVMLTYDERYISNDEVWASTGKEWNEWRALLDRWVEHEKRFAATAAYLVREHGLSYIWAQVVALYYVLDLLETPVPSLP
jgi:hypothetical protein